jgi:hypothetical protein
LHLNIFAGKSGFSQSLFRKQLPWKNGFGKAHFFRLRSHRPMYSRFQRAIPGHDFEAENQSRHGLFFVRVYVSLDIKQIHDYYFFETPIPKVEIHNIKMR